MSEPAPRETPSGAEPSPGPEGSPASGRDLRVGYRDGLVHHAALGRGYGGRRSIGRAFGRFIALLIVAGLVWTVWAAAAFYDLTLGLRSGDAVTLERRIDWTSVQQALREDLQGGAVTPSGDRSIDALLGRRAIANLLRTAKLDEHGWEVTPQPPSWVSNPSFDWRRIHYAFFTGGPITFRVDLEPDGGTFREPLVMLFRWSGDWRLARIFLPPSPKAALASLPPLPPKVEAPATPSPVAVPSTPSQAVFFEDVPDRRDGRRSSGKVTWRAEQARSTTGSAASLTVIAHVSIPDRPLDMTMTIRRNLDPALPATHMFEINFVQPADTDPDGVTSMVGVTMKPDEALPGQTLTGSHVKVRDGFFLLALSALATDTDRNMSLLKEQPWFGIPIRFKNGTRGVLAIEKGEAGQASLANAFAQWTAAASAQKK